MDQHSTRPPLLTTYQHAVRTYTGNCRDDALLIDRENSLRVYYAPFDHVNTSARVILVGITPGATQAENALAEAKRALSGGSDPAEATRRGQLTGAFSGGLRKNLIAMLDEVGVQRWLGITSCDKLFANDAALLQSTSVLPFPVFLEGANYAGAPDPMRSLLLSGLIESHFVPQLRQLSSAVIVPLGPVPTRVIESLCVRGLVDSHRVLSGLPHPSGANAERIAYFLGRKVRSLLSNRTSASSLDASKVRIIERVQQLPPVR